MNSRVRIWTGQKPCWYQSLPRWLGSGWSWDLSWSWKGILQTPEVLVKKDFDLRTMGNLWKVFGMGGVGCVLIKLKFQKDPSGCWEWGWEQTGAWGLVGGRFLPAQITIMVDLEQASTSVEWSYVAAVRQCKALRKVNPTELRMGSGRGEGEGRGQGWWPGLGLAVLAGKSLSFGGLRSSENWVLTKSSKSGVSMGALLSSVSLLWSWFRIVFECFLSALIPFPQYLFLEI